MPRLVLSLFCQQVVVDQSTNNLSVINQYDELLSAPPPASLGMDKTKTVVAPLQCALLTIWERSKPEIAESSSMVVQLFSPAGKKVAEFSFHLDMRKFKRVRSIGNLPGLPVVGEGVYKFVIRARHGTKWKRAGVVTYTLKYVVPEPAKGRRKLN